METGLPAEQPGFISLITLAGVSWVLQECYGADREQLSQVVEGLLSSRQIIVEQSEAARRALRTWKASAADFSDALVGQVAIEVGCAKVATFDRKAATLNGFELLA
jgi:predicted nucleic-acid-binding protein